ncbi:MAG: hypothetical protein ABS35_21455 [Kaistia sp. SCN 65-12]|nr:MAG: hypothetical protein ABS35_21455 [Kaistia sp. SCN 65-12]
MTSDDPVPGKATSPPPVEPRIEDPLEARLQEGSAALARSAVALEKIDALLGTGKETDTPASAHDPVEEPGATPTPRPSR